MGCVTTANQVTGKFNSIPHLKLLSRDIRWHLALVAVTCLTANFAQAAGKFPAVLKLAELNGENGFTIEGRVSRPVSGFSVSKIGDVNGDGFDDIAVGAPYAHYSGTKSGASYVVFGNSSGFIAANSLTMLDGSNGFRIDGVSADHRSGWSVNAAGDINGDGVADLIIGAPYRDENGSEAGRSYVVFGRTEGFGRTVHLSSLDGSNGFRLDGVSPFDHAGHSVSTAGDINGDGLSDLIIGAPYTDHGGSDSGSGYVVFGRTEGFEPTLSLSTLDGSTGFRLDGISASDRSGWSVSALGDINSDGFDDLVIGAPRANFAGYDTGSSYVVFGRTGDFGPTLNLSALDGGNGFFLHGENNSVYLGRTTSAAGDVNGDGVADMIIGAPHSSYSGSLSGSSYVVFGRTYGFNAALSVTDLNGSTGFRIDGASAFDQSGFSVSAAGDINGDALSDLVIGAPYADYGGPLSGSSYILFGSTEGFSATISFASLNGANGFRLDGAEASGFSGGSVSTAGDFNGDDVDDFIIGAPWADNGGLESGSSYIVFGKTESFSPVLSLSTLNGTNGIRWDGYSIDSRFSGRSVSDAGDINGDGADDLIIGAWNTSNGASDLGSSFVVLGPVDQGMPILGISELNGSNGFRLIASSGSDQSGWSVSRAGDVNGDDLGDLVIGAPHSGFGGSFSGSSYVVFGSTTTFKATLELSSLNGSNGFRLDGASAFDRSGISVNSAGDINGDGIDDMIVGATKASNSGSYTGSSYVVFGRTSGFSAVIGLSVLDGNSGFRIDGVNANDYTGQSVGPAGDINGDGLADVFIASPSVDNGGTSSGSSYVVFGHTDGFGSTMTLSELDGNNGFRLDGVSGGHVAGYSVSAAGDINSDGVDDLIIGAGGTEYGGQASGSSYVVFGRTDGFIPAMSLSELDGSNGFRLDGVSGNDHTGNAVSNAGDINDDGIDDLLVGAPNANNEGSGSGSSYVVFGRTDEFGPSMSLSTLDGSNGFRIDGVSAYDNSGSSVSFAGDMNGDGVVDLLIGAPRVGNGDSDSGSSYVVFGRDDRIFINGFETLD